MKNGRCPKCNSTNVFRNIGGIQFGDEDGTLEVWFGTPDSGSGKEATYESFLCTDCGFFENYLLDRKILDTAAVRWTKV